MNGTNLQGEIQQASGKKYSMGDKVVATVMAILFLVSLAWLFVDGFRFEQAHRFDVVQEYVFCGSGIHPVLLSETVMLNDVDGVGLRTYEINTDQPTDILEEGTRYKFYINEDGVVTAYQHYPPPYGLVTGEC